MLRLNANTLADLEKISSVDTDNLVSLLERGTNLPVEDILELGPKERKHVVEKKMDKPIGVIEIIDDLRNDINVSYPAKCDQS